MKEKIKQLLFTDFSSFPTSTKISLITTLFFVGALPVMMLAVLQRTSYVPRAYYRTMTPITPPFPSISPTAVSRVFITSTRYNGNLGGLAGADAKCQVRANVANLGGTWKAWLSDSAISVSSRLSHNDGPYKLLNGTVIADNWNDLTDGTIKVPITITELNQTKYPAVWSSTNTDGTSLSIPTNRYFTSCNNWTSTDSRDHGYFGYAGSYTDSRWTYGGDIICTQNLSLYCFEQTLFPTPTPRLQPKPTALPTIAGCFLNGRNCTSHSQCCSRYCGQTFGAKGVATYACKDSPNPRF